MPLERAIGRAILQALSVEGIGASRMIAIARRAGGGYRYQDMLADTRTFLGRFKYQTQVEAMTGNLVVPRAWMTETELVMARRYMVHGEATYWNSETMQYETGWRSMYTDSLGKIEDWERDYEGYIKEMEYPTEVEFISFRVRAVDHAKGWSY